jgi:hypothetical protein
MNVALSKQSKRWVALVLGVCLMAGERPHPPTGAFAQPSQAALPRSARIQAIAGKGKVRIQRDDPPNSFFARQAQN